MRQRPVLEADDLDVVDAFRLLHPDADEASWVWRGHSGEVGRRFDHILVSRSARPLSIAYRHAWRERDASGRRLSDHSALVADIEIANADA